MKKKLLHIKIEGLEDLNRVIVSGQKGVTDATKEALYAEASMILNESKKQVPFRTGVLSGSGMVHDPFVVGKKVGVEISYGGGAVDYALVQHENLKFRHAPGRKAKYLEDPVADAKDRLSGRIRQLVALILRRKGVALGEIEEFEYGENEDE